MTSTASGEVPGIPDWFADALAQACDEVTLEVEGSSVTYRAWGKPGAPVAVLVHGGAAHSGWWDHVGPHLADGHRVVALDLSGHGDSAWRHEYTLERWAGEVLAVARAEGDGAPVVFGHSMGGFVALTAAKLYGAQLAGVVAIDSPVHEMSSETKARIESGEPLRDNRVYPSRDEILAHFRTLPADAAGLEYVRRHLAEGSVREVEGGWTWKFDPHIFLRSRMEPEELARAECPVVLLRGDRGMATTDITAEVAERLGGEVPVTVIRDSGHHIMIDQPIALIATLQTLLGQWRSR